MAGYQYTVIVGNVGRDPEMRYTQAGVAVCDFSVAVSRKWGKGEERQEETIWFKIVCWRQLAEIANEYVVKGKQVMVAGRVSFETWADSEGEPRGTLVLTAQEMQMLGARAEVEDESGHPF